MKTATHIKKFDRTPATGSSQKIYKLSEPLEGAKYVCVSAIPCAFDTGSSETYIFECDENGKVLSFREIGASQRHTESHDKVLVESGYEPVY